MIAILAAVLFTILLVVGNTMAQAVRERTSELAVLKTLGFSDVTVLSLVLAESLFVAIVGGGLGLFLAWLFVQGGDPTNGMLPTFTLPTRDIVLGIALMVLVGIAAGILPAAGAMRLKITDALRKA
jgi:putative ABC transport system permease protein